MSDYIRIHGHSRPWSPAADAELRATYRLDKVPIMGQLHQRGRHYLFWLMERGPASSTIWAYAAISPSEVEEIESASNLDETFGRITAGKPVVVAFHLEDRGIVSWRFAERIPTTTRTSDSAVVPS